MLAMWRTRHQTLYTAMIAVVLGFFAVSSSSGTTLFLAHYNGSTANADFAVGSPVASGVAGYPASQTTGPGEGKWGSGLDVRTNGDGKCSYSGLDNLDPVKGTVDFWFVRDQDGLTYQPIFGWYNAPGAKTTGFELYMYGTYNRLVLGFYQPYAEAGLSNFIPVVGQWHHLEINWDCTGGDGASEFNVYLDGQNVIRKTGWNALGAPGGEIRMGIWDYAEGGYYLHGRMDELRITDQIEHTSDFAPPTNEYYGPGTPPGVADTYDRVAADAAALEGDLADLATAMEIAQWTTEACDAAAVESSITDTSAQAADVLASIYGQFRQAYMTDHGLSDTVVGQVTATAVPASPPPDPCQLGWMPGDTPPAYWTIDTPDPGPFGDMDFTAPLVTREFDPCISDGLRDFRTNTFSNAYWASFFNGGTPALSIDQDAKTIELSFIPPSLSDGATACDPIAGAQGAFGPLNSGGDWLLFSDEPGASFSLPFHVSYADCADAWASADGLSSDLDRNCYVDIGDLRYMAADWLRCNEPGDADCENTPAANCAELWQITGGIRADLNQDCYVDSYDYWFLAGDWFRCNDPCQPGCEIFE